MLELGQDGERPLASRRGPGEQASRLRGRLRGSGSLSGKGTLSSAPAVSVAPWAGRGCEISHSIVLFHAVPRGGYASHSSCPRVPSTL